MDPLGPQDPEVSLDLLDLPDLRALMVWPVNLDHLDLGAGPDFLDFLD